MSASGSRRHLEVTADWASFKHLPRWDHLTCKGDGDLWFVTRRWAGQVELGGREGGWSDRTAAAVPLMLIL